MGRQAFITGSNAYGRPNADSDLDLVVYLTPSECRKLQPYSDSGRAVLDVTGGSFSLRFGRLNLLVCTDPDSYQAWKDGTEALIARKPVYRQEAVDEFIRQRAEKGVFVDYDGGGDSPDPPEDDGF